MTEQKKGRAPIAVLIAAACAIAAPTVMHFEGKRNRVYLDPIKLPTVCYGHMDRSMKVGTRFSDDRCEALLEGDLRDHAEGAARCTPTILDKPEIFAAVTSLTFNIGVSRYCNSTAARKLNSGDYRGGCAALGLFNRAGGRLLPGLVRRRKAEVALCLRGIE
jgi:lysozyme